MEKLTHGQFLVGAIFSSLAQSFFDVKQQKMNENVSSVENTSKFHTNLWRCLECAKITLFVRIDNYCFNTNVLSVHVS